MQAYRTVLVSGSITIMSILSPKLVCPSSNGTWLSDGNFEQVSHPAVLDNLTGVALLWQYLVF